MSEITNRIVFDTVRIEDNINEKPNVASFDVLDTSGATVPATDDEIAIVKNGTKLFAGLINRVSMSKKQSGMVRHACEAVDYTRLLDRYLVAQTYEDMTDAEIIADIIDTYCAGSGITYDNVVGTTTINQISFNWIQVSSAIQKLAELTGQNWYIDYDKDIHYFPADTNAAPFDIDSTNNDYTNLTIAKDSSNLKNRVYVRGGTELSEAITVSQSADGTQRQFILPDKPHNFSMTQNGVAKTVGIKNIDDPGAYDYLLNYQEKYVECGTNTTTPTAGTTMAFTYQYDIPILVAVEDNDSILESGVFEFLITDTSIATTEAARARAQAELTDYANDLIDGSFETLEDGFRSGQTININLSEYGINDDYIVKKVSLISMGAGTYRYVVSIASAKTLGIIKFLLDLLEQSKGKVSLNTDEKVDELLTVTDSLDSLIDSLIIDSSANYAQWSESPSPLGPRGKWDLGQWR